MDYERNKKYFEEDGALDSWVWKVLGGLLLFMGIIMLICALKDISDMAGILIGALIFIAIGVLCFLHKDTNKLISDEEYDAMISNHIADIRNKALEKLGIDEDEVKEIDPIFIGGFDYDSYSLAKLGKDNKWRTNRYKILYLFFSPEAVHCYAYDFTTTEKKRTESTDVYFYQDIVSASTASTTVTLTDAKSGQKKSLEYEYFKLTTSAGTALTVTMRNISEAQRSVNAMRQLLKAKKEQG